MNPAAFRAVVDRTLRRRGMLKGNERVLVAVSGGPDSLALLYALHALSDAWKLELHVAHFDHRLREDSGRDAEFVAGVARGLGLAVTLGASDPDDRGGLSPEEAARERRLAFLEGVAEVGRVDCIATGHTLDDQAETVLMRLLSGGGLRGLGGIPPVRGAYIRPLIDVRRSDTNGYCDALGLRPRRDPTNDDSSFLRNAIRLEAIPFLSERFNRRLPEALSRFADTFRDDDALLESMTPEIETDDGSVRLDVEQLRAMHRALRRRTLRKALGDPPPDLAHVDAIAELAESGKSGDRIDLPHGLNARREYGFVLVGRGQSSVPAVDPVRLLLPGRTELPEWDAAAVAWEGRRMPDVWPDGKRTAVMDAQAVGETVVVRAPRSGDRIAPLGLGGSRSVADILSDAKVPRARRPRVPVVARQDGEIVWLVGHRLSEEVKVTEDTRRYLWITFEGGQTWRS